MIALVFLGIIGAFFVRELSIAFYNFYFHPLKGFPGPKLWIAFPVLRYVAQCQGTFDERMVKYHRQYGEVVRFSNDSLSFATAQAWKDIYGYGHGQTQWPKQEFRPPGAGQHILFSNDANHAKFRKALAHAFSEQALRLQEPLIKKYIDMLIDALHEEAGNGRDVDMTMWYNLTTFDIISDLAFGEPSNCLKSKQYTDYIIAIFKFVRDVPFVMLARFYPSVWKTFSLFMGRRVARSRAGMFRLGDEAVQRRKNDSSKDGRGDFMEALIKHSEQKDPITDAELSGNAHILFLAGSETTATLLAGVTYWMLRTPETMRRAVEEVRSAFEKEEDITFSSASSKLPYTLACLEEGLRKYPPVPTILMRTVPDVVTVSGYTVPPGTHVGVHQMSTNHLPANFNDPESFHPERWLPDAAASPKSQFFNDNRDTRQPFSVGPRNCIGKNLAFSEMRQILARVLWNFDLKLVDKEADWANQKVFSLWQKGPLMCRITERENGK